MQQLKTPFKKESGMSRDELYYWTLEHACKEFAQNYVFGVQTTKSKKQGKTWYDDEKHMAFWEDYNEQGIDLKYLLIGNSGQRHIENSPGEFGEGMKKALLIASREECTAYIETIGYLICGQFEIGSLNAEEFIFTITSSNRTIGTKFALECDEETYLKANSFFGYIKYPEKQNMFETNNILNFPDVNSLFLNGVYINSDQKLLASYNLVGKQLNVRDRDKIDSYKMNNYLWEMIIGKTTNINLIEKIIKNINESYLETYYIKYSYIPDENIKYWEKALKNLYGDKICTSFNPFSDEEMTYRGYHIIYAYDSYAQNLFNKLGIKSSMTLLSNAGKKVLGDHLKLKDLTTEQKNNLKTAISIIKEYYCNFMYNVKVVENLRDNNGTIADGLCSYDNCTIFINYSIIDSFRKLFKTLVHETVHQKSKANDCTPEFEDEFENACFHLAKGIRKSNNLEELPED